MTEELQALGSVRTRGILLLALVALAAGAAGGAIDRVWVARNADEGRSEPPSGRNVGSGEDRHEESRMARTDRSLEERRPPSERGGVPISLRSIDLSPDQRQRIEKISAQFQPAAESIAKTVRERILALDLQMRQQAMCVLTPKQRDDWIAWRKRERLIVEENGAMMALVKAGTCPK